MAICEACHQQKLVGGVAAPRLAGQKYDYLVESMRRFAEGQRKNSPEMSGIMQAISASDREAMARYISGPLTRARRNLTCVAKRRYTAMPKSVDPARPAQAGLKVFALRD